MKDGQWYSIAGWMGKRLGLRANDLICFAVIYGFSMDGESQFKGTSIYLSKCMFASEPTAILCIKHLLSCNLILKQEDVVNGRKRCYYSTNVIYNEGYFDVVDTTKEPLVITTKEPLVITTKETLVKEYSNKDNINNKEKRLSNDNPKKSRFVKPTVEQIDDYIREKELDFDAEKFYDYYESKGWMIGKNHMKDWKAACRTWQHNIKSQESKEEKEEAVEIPADDIPKWEQNKKWMQSKMPKWSKKIDYDMFATMRAMVCFNSRQYAAVLEDMYNSGFDGDIVAEFKRRVCYE